MFILAQVNESLSLPQLSHERKKIKVHVPHHHTMKTCDQTNEKMCLREQSAYQSTHVCARNAPVFRSYFVTGWEWPVQHHHPQWKKRAAKYLILTYCLLSQQSQSFTFSSNLLPQHNGDTEAFAPHFESLFLAFPLLLPPLNAARQAKKAIQHRTVVFYFRTPRRTGRGEHVHFAVNPANLC